MSRIIPNVVLLSLLALSYGGCRNQSIQNLSLSEIESRINGAWKLKSTYTSHDTTEFDYKESNSIILFAFDSLRGWQGDLVDNGDGTYQAHSCDPQCELRARGSRKILHYSLPYNEDWEKEIKKISNKELILKDSFRTWIYIRHEMSSTE
jgi:hypothetical protein